MLEVKVRDAERTRCSHDGPAPAAAALLGTHKLVAPDGGEPQRN